MFHTRFLVTSDPCVHPHSVRNGFQPSDLSLRAPRNYRRRTRIRWSRHVEARVASRAELSEEAEACADADSVVVAGFFGRVPPQSIGVPFAETPGRQL